MMENGRRCESCHKMPALERLAPYPLCADCFEQLHVVELQKAYNVKLRELGTLSTLIHKNIALHKGPSPSSLYAGEDYKCRTCDFHTPNFVLASLHVEELNHRIEFLKGVVSHAERSPRAAKPTQPTVVTVEDL